MQQNGAQSPRLLESNLVSCSGLQLSMGASAAACAFAVGSSSSGSTSRSAWSGPSSQAVGSRRTVPAAVSSANVATLRVVSQPADNGSFSGIFNQSAASASAVVGITASLRKIRRKVPRGRGCAVALAAEAVDYGLTPKLTAMSKGLKSLPNDKIRYQQLLALANKLEPMPAELKVPENKVPGCLSTVHVFAKLQDDGTFKFWGDSDALISKGLVALLVNGLQDCTAEQISKVKPEFLKDSGITASLTPGRNNGFFNMFKLMNKKAAELSGDEVAAAALVGVRKSPKTAVAAAASTEAPAESDLTLYNTMSREKEVFQPLTPGVVNMYVCGVTVYDLCHLGHARVMVFFDVVARHLKHLGYQVKYVRNVTDVDDKIIKRSKENDESVDTLSRRMEEEMQKDAASLGCDPPTVEPRVSEHIEKIVSMVQGLEDDGHAYSGAPVEGTGKDVYFHVRSFPTYGRLSRCSLDGNQAGARVEVGGGKKAPEDFVLWKAAKVGEPQWETRWGPGRPGWHIECSAMAREHLGDTLDIHGGGPDLMFPHHENEIAQSEAHNKQSYVRTWMHCAAVRSGGQEKMSKSLGNFVTIRDVLKQHDGEALRFYLLSSQYRQPMQFSEENLCKAEERLLMLYSSLRGVPSDSTEPADDTILVRRKSFETAMSNDFDTVNAVIELSEIAKELRQLQQKEDDSDADRRAGMLARELRAMGAVLGILQQDPEKVLRGGGGDEVDSEFEARVDALIEERAVARNDKNWSRADEIRDELASLNVVLDDASGGGGGKTTWRVAATVSA